MLLNIILDATQRAKTGVTTNTLTTRQLPINFRQKGMFNRALELGRQLSEDRSCFSIRRLACTCVLAFLWHVISRCQSTNPILKITSYQVGTKSPDVILLRPDPPTSARMHRSWLVWTFLGKLPRIPFGASQLSRKTNPRWLTAKPTTVSFD